MGWSQRDSSSDRPGAPLQGPPSASRRFTPAGLGESFDRHWSGEVKVEGFGSLRTCPAFLRGEAAEDLPIEAIDVSHAIGSESIRIERCSSMTPTRCWSAQQRLASLQ